MSSRTMNPPPVIPRKHSVLTPHSTEGRPPHPQVNGKKGFRRLEHDVELLNHCISDVEQFMAKLQQAADAQHSQEQNMNKKKGNKKKKKQGYDVMVTEASLLSEQEFVDIFQKIKYSLGLLDSLKTDIEDPNSEELLHHLFVPLYLMVKTTGGPNLAASVSSPTLTSGAISFLQHNLRQEEKELWSSLGPYWTQANSQHGKSVPPYTPVFLDGWKPDEIDASSPALIDPVESQNRRDAHLRHQKLDNSQLPSPIQLPEESAEIPIPTSSSDLQMYRCSYYFVARNINELSVLNGEALQVLDSSKRWWLCRNIYNQIGFVPSNVLEPIKETEPEHSVVTRKPSNVPLSPSGRFSYIQPSPTRGEQSHEGTRPISMQPMECRLVTSVHAEVMHAANGVQTCDFCACRSDGERVMLMNNELAQRLANGRPGSARPLVINKASDTTVPLNYNSPPDEVQEWLRGKGFSDSTATRMGVLTGAQLFSLSKEELCKVSPLEGARVYSQIMVQKAQLETERKSTELEAVMRKQKMKVDPSIEGGEL